jgi:PhnB protein
MPENRPEGYGQITPYLLYEDADAAIDFLTRAFGFTEKYRLTDENGRVNHAEVVLGDGLVMFGRPPGDYKNPKRLGGTTQLVYVYVDDVDKHFEQAKAAGATITQEPEDQAYGDRTYGADDPEGHSWTFATHVRDVSAAEMQSAMAGAEAG